MKSLNYIFNLALLMSVSDAFYVPGIAPREFTRGSKIGEWILMMLANSKKNFKYFLTFSEVKAVKMTSTRTQLPYEYYSLQFCLPKNGTLHYKSENLGEVLRGKIKNWSMSMMIFLSLDLDFLGDRIVNTPYEVRMAENVNCKLLCNTKSLPMNWDMQQSKKVAERIEHEYFVHLLVDNLPVATRIVNPDTMELQFEHGYRLGMMSKTDPYINNHLKFVLAYHAHSK
jgi:transmembrane 9 superfamily protein 2/4